MAAGFRGLLAPWVGGAGAVASAPAASAAPRSMLAPWAGGAAVPTDAPTAAPGLRSLLAPWVGGAGADAAVIAPPGLRSLLAFWTGGAGSSAAPDQPIVALPRRTGRGLSVDEEDDILLAVCAALVAGPGTLIH